jgi:hypothetical protein
MFNFPETRQIYVAAHISDKVSGFDWYYSSEEAAVQYYTLIEHVKKFPKYGNRAFLFTVDSPKYLESGAITDFIQEKLLEYTQEAMIHFQPE